MNKVWTSKDMSKATKLQVYETMILSTLLYNSDTWTLKTTQQNRLKVFEMSCLRKIEGVTRRDHIRNEDIFDRLKLSQDIHSRIQHRRLRYFVHVSRMGQDRYPKLLYNSETWTLKTTQQNRLKVFEMSCLRKTEGVTRRDHIRNEDIFHRLKLSQDIHSRIQQRRLPIGLLWPCQDPSGPIRGPAVL